MGGNALKMYGVDARRIELEEFEELSREVVAELELFDDDIKLHIVQSYSEKKDFGDIDIIMTNQANNRLREQVETTFNPAAIHTNGSMLSFEYKRVQVDLITCSPDQFMNTQMFADWNDFGMLLGRMAHAVGLKYGSHGLEYRLNRGSNEIRLPVTLDPRRILAFMGLDYDVYKGTVFANPDDIFNFIKESTFFNPAFFLPENNNHVYRKKSRNRVVLNHVMDLCRNMPDTGFYPKPLKHSEILPTLFEKFPDFIDLYLASEKDHLLDMEFRKKFNGGLVSQILGVEGKELGEVMIAINKSFNTKDHLRAFVVSCTEDEVIDFIATFSR